MKILNYGSLNLDHVYRVKNFVQPGETIHSTDYKVNCGGKGLNQSIALARSGAKVFHAGVLGRGAEMLSDMLTKNNVDVSYLVSSALAPGHAIIQVDDKGENCIMLFGGSNMAIATEDITATISGFEQGDILLVQNEINRLEEIINLAKKQGMKVAFNPAPFDATVLKLPLDKVDYLIVNEIEGEGLFGESEPKKITQRCMEKYPKTAIVLTLGAKGSRYCDATTAFDVSAEPVEKVVDTTAAGDTFIGYFLSGIAAGNGAKTAMKTAAKAAAICVSHAGAAESIPTL